MTNKIFFALLFFSSLLVHPKLPYIKYGFHNLLVPLFAVVLFCLNVRHLKDVIKYHRKALIFGILLFIWIWICSFFSNFKETAIKFTIKYSAYPIVLFSFLLLRSSYHYFIFRFLTLIAIFGIIEAFFPNLFIFHLLRPPESLGVYPRISSFLQSPNIFGVLMACGLILGLILKVSKIELYFSILLFIINLSLSSSRNGWLVFILGLFLASLYNKRITLTKISLLICIFLFLIASFQVSRVRLGLRSLFFDSARITLWKAALYEVSKRPITGIGLRVFDEHVASKIFEKKGYHTHNLFLNILVELGIPGFFLSLIFIYSLLKKVDFYNPLASIPITIVFFSQMVDFFIHDFTFTIISLYFLAFASNSKIERI
ncbi:MAG: O-antigen ligase family protein [bacterium]